MSLDRDELAARFLASLLTKDNGAPRQLADFALECADALLSRLSAPSPVKCDAPRPEWVRITSRNAGGVGFLTVGKVYRVTGWGHRNCPQVTNDQGDGMWCLSSRGLSPDPEAMTFASWEPCPAPSSPPSCDATATYVPTPAKSGAAAYVPQVGDVVALAPNPFVSATDHRDSYGAHLYRVVRAQVDSDGCVECVRVDGRDTTSPFCISPGAMRPASASERAAAGLPPAEATRSVDREGLMKAIHYAIDKWHGCSSDERDIDEVRADAAIAYFKNGGVA